MVRRHRLHCGMLNRGRVEAACYFLQSPDGKSCAHAKEYQAAIEALVDKIAKAQQPDGYLDIYFTVVDPKGRFMNLRDMHEMCEYPLKRGVQTTRQLSAGQTTADISWRARWRITSTLVRESSWIVWSRYFFHLPQHLPTQQYALLIQPVR